MSNWDFNNGKKRTWQCFVCGKNHNDPQTFKEHIVENHEEGREFLLCPLKRCQSPVRDLYAHFKAKHPTEKIPTFKQNKAIIWADISTKNGETKVTKRKPKFRSGHFVSIKNGCDVPYRSGLECSLYEIIEHTPEIIKYSAEPLSISYFFEGEKHEYIPDLQVQYSDGRIEIWEIKPMNETKLPKNQAKWESAAKYCKNRGWAFQVVTEKYISKLKKKFNNKST